jgi:hypothetical protein
MGRETPLVHITSAAAAGSSSKKNLIIRKTTNLYIFKVLLCPRARIHYGLSKLDFKLIKGKNRN